MRILTKIAPVVEITIYTLTDGGERIRYVGQTSGSLHSRLSQHIASAKAGRMGNDALRHWILSCLNRKRRPVILPLETCYSKTQADMAERHHIEQCETLYGDLLNLKENDGRTQGRPFTEAYIARMG